MQQQLERVLLEARELGAWSGAAIGVHESITTILRQAERMPVAGDRLALHNRLLEAYGTSSTPDWI